MAKIAQYFKDKAKTIKDYPKTLMKAVYGDDGQRLDNVLNGMNSTINEFGEYKGISTVLSGTVSLKDTSLVSGHYVCDSVINGPDDTRLTGGYIDVEAHPNSAYRKVKFSPYGLNEWYVITCSGGTWSGWEKLVTDSNLIILEASTTVNMTANRELDDATEAIKFPSGYKPIAMYMYNSNNNDNVSALPLLIRSNGRILYHAKNHSASDQGVIEFVVRVTFKRM